MGFGACSNTKQTLIVAHDHLFSLLLEVLMDLQAFGRVGPEVERQRNFWRRKPLLNWRFFVFQSCPSVPNCGHRYPKADVTPDPQNLLF